MNYLKKKSEQQEQQTKKKKKNRLHRGTKRRSQAKNKDENSSDSSSNSSPTHKPSKNKEVKANKQGNEIENKGDNLLLNLMEKNVKEGEFTPEQKTLYEAHDVLMAEYRRRKDQRHKVGGLFAKNKRNLKSILQNAISRGHVESDLQLKARSQDLQKRRRDKKKKKFMSFSAIVDADKI